MHTSLPVCPLPHSLQSFERQLLGSNGASNGRLHLFSSAWSSSKWHSNGAEPHPR